MKRQYKSTFRNSDMDRAKPKSHIFRAIINRNLKQHRSNMGLVEDRTNSVTVVRLIIALLLIHLIVIGGVILRGKIKSGESGPIAQATITPPPPAAPAAPAEPAAPAAPAAPVNDVLPQPVEGPTSNPVRVADNNTGHITQPPAETNTLPATPEPEIVTPPVVEPTAVAVEEPVAPTPAPAPAPAQPIKHLVTQGDTLYGIATKYNVNLDAIRKANPSVRGSNIICGTYLSIPVKADSAAAREVAAQQAEAAPQPTVKTYTIVSGDSLKKIAKKHNTTVAKLLELNNIPKEKANKIRTGDTLRVAE